VSQYKDNEIGESYTILSGSGAISWAAREQKVVAASSCQAKYIAAFETAGFHLIIKALPFSL
jgi:hypothetical protein